MGDRHAEGRLSVEQGVGSQLRGNDVAALNEVRQLPVDECPSRKSDRPQTRRRGQASGVAGEAIALL